MSPSLSAWSRTLLVVLVVLCVLVVVAIGAGAVLAVDDTASDSDAWDGVGTALGLVLAGFALIALGLKLALVLLLRSARSTPDLRRVNLAARMSAVLAFTVVILVLWMAVGQALGHALLAAIVGPAVVLAVPAVGTLRAVRSEAA